MYEGLGRCGRGSGDARSRLMAVGVLARIARLVEGRVLIASL